MRFSHFLRGLLVMSSAFIVTSLVDKDRVEYNIMSILKFVNHCSKFAKTVTCLSSRISSLNHFSHSHLKLSSINLTDDCVKRLKELSVKYPHKYLRVAVEGGGCSGFQYIFNLDPHVSEDDW